MMDQYQDQETNEVLVRRALFGKQVEAFLVSDVGRYMISRADDEISSAFDEIKMCDPKDGKVVQALQNKIWKAETFKQWMEDAVIDGLQAMNVINEKE